MADGRTNAGLQPLWPDHPHRYRGETEDLTRLVRHDGRVDNVARTIACVYLAGLCANLFLWGHLLTHFASNLGLTRFLTSLLASACGLVIVNGEGVLLLANALMTHHTFYGMESTVVFKVANVVLQAATLFLLHFICLVSLLRIFCQPALNRSSRTCKMASGTLIALFCTAVIGALAYSDCYYKFNTTLWYFAYRCAAPDAMNRLLSLSVLTYEPPALCATCLLLVYCGALCSGQNLMEPARRKPQKRARESTVLDAPVVSVVSANESTTPSRRRLTPHEKKNVLVQTNILGLLFFLLIDSLIRVALPYQAQLASEFFGAENRAGTRQIPSLRDSDEAAERDAPSTAAPAAAGAAGRRNASADSFTFSNLNFVDRRVEGLALALNCAHLLLVGVALPLCHFSANTRLRATFAALVRAAGRALTCRPRDDRENGNTYAAR